MSKSRWTQQYYDSVEYYFWDPTKLKPPRKAEADSNVSAVLGRLRRLEEPLNHIMALFLDLAPGAFRHELALGCADLDLGARSYVGDRQAHDAVGGGNVVQPDILISGDDGLLAIEVKLGSPSKLTKVLKYALLLSRLADGRSTALTYLTLRPFEHHFPGRLTPTGVRAAALEHLSSVPKLGLLALDDQLRTEIAGSLDRMTITSWRFEDLDRLLSRWAARPVMSAGDETLHRLCLGLIDELRARQLSNSPTTA